MPTIIISVLSSTILTSIISILLSHVLNYEADMKKKRVEVYTNFLEITKQLVVITKAPSNNSERVELSEKVSSHLGITLTVVLLSNSEISKLAIDMNTSIVRLISSIIRGKKSEELETEMIKQLHKITGAMQKEIQKKWRNQLTSFLLGN